MSHEFQALTSAGEDTLLACTTCDFGQNSEIATSAEGDACPNGDGVLKFVKGIEVGNIFDLGTKYSDAFEVDATNESGERQRVLMGCYGIGTTRLVGALVETLHDDRGIIWPASIAPFAVHLVSLNTKNAEMQTRITEEARDLYDALVAQGIEVLWDDRTSTPGEKLADADLIGCPLRVLISEKSLKEESIEWKLRTSQEAQFVTLQNSVEEICAFVRE
jgi:prolyl-tRNA synthetase